MLKFPIQTSFALFLLLFRIYFNMKKEYILFIDSGIGGLSTLAEAKKHVKANYIYFADALNAPYGKHTKKELLVFLKKIIDETIKHYKVKVVVLACNTATTSCISSLRECYPNLKFVGTEPAIKLAALSHKRILALTTPTTAKQHKFLLLKHNANAKICTLAIFDLAKNIEQHLTSATFLSRMNLLKNLYFISHEAAKHEALVLGCTHYVFIESFLKKTAKKPCYSGNLGVAKQLKRLANTENIRVFEHSSVLFFCSISSKTANQNYKKILSQILAKLENVC